eukprot:720649-Pyramimonas_sp.AAC.1
MLLAKLGLPQAIQAKASQRGPCAALALLSTVRSSCRRDEPAGASRCGGEAGPRTCGPLPTAPAHPPRPVR